MAEKTEDKKAKKAKTAKTAKTIKKLKEENQQLKDQLLRKMAEFENFRKRTETALSGSIKRANEDLVSKLIPVIDDLERSLKQENDEKNNESFLKGFEMIYNKLSTLLKDAGLQEIESDGCEFDPEIHEAMIQVENKDVPSNHIVETYEKGYYFKERVIRASRVIVSK
ncbi:MAG: nucleotide exchange factor GrpE [bacterium]|nr:nucleotide exchange factor GrpE [bacterium]